MVPTRAGSAAATEQLQAFAASFLRDLQSSQVPLDALCAVPSAARDGDVSEAEAVECLSHSLHWVWTAIDPQSKLLLSVQVGERPLAIAQAVLHQITQLVAPGAAAAGRSIQRWSRGSI